MVEVYISDGEGTTKGAHEMKSQCNKGRLIVYSDCESLLRNNDLSLYVGFHRRAFLWRRCHFRFVYDEFDSPGGGEPRAVEGAGGREVKFPLTLIQLSNISVSPISGPNGFLILLQPNGAQNPPNRFSKFGSFIFIHALNNLL